MLMQFTVATHNHYLTTFMKYILQNIHLLLIKQNSVQWFNLMINVYFTNTYLSICFALKCIDYTMQNLFNFIICTLKLVVCLCKKR